MQERRKAKPLTPMMMLFCIIFQIYFSKALGASSVVFPVNGNGHTGRANIDIGRPDKSFELHIDSGSDLTWVQCDSTCENCNEPREHLYKPPEGSIVKCHDQLCFALHGDDHHCVDPTGRCEYEFDYAGGKSTEGYLVRDVFPLQLINETVIHPRLVFGCGYKQSGDFKGNGLLGLGSGRVSLLSQMHSQGLIQKVGGHCLSSGEGGGFLFLGDNLVPPSGVSWTPILSNYKENYLAGPVDLLFDGRRNALVKFLQFDFDSGLSLSYLNRQAYVHTLDMINEALQETPLELANSEGELSICWRRDGRPIRSLNNIVHFFKELTLKFTELENIKLELPVKNYLILVGEKVCLGILDGDKSDMVNGNVIGANLMQDKLVIYDNVNSRIGWTVARSCSSSPKT